MFKRNDKHLHFASMMNEKEKKRLWRKSSSFIMTESLTYFDYIWEAAPSGLGLFIQFFFFLSLIRRWNYLFSSSPQHVTHAQTIGRELFIGLFLLFIFFKLNSQAENNYFSFALTNGEKKKKNTVLICFQLEQFHCAIWACDECSIYPFSRCLTWCQKHLFYLCANCSMFTFHLFTFLFCVVFRCLRIFGEVRKWSM